MRYLELTPGSATLVEGDVPEPAEGEALVRMLACGVCGTDLHLLHRTGVGERVEYPVRPGHEVAGVVEEVRDSGGRVARGDLVVLHPLATCGACRDCASGNEQRCARARVLGIDAPGGLAEQLVWPAARTAPVHGVEPALAALLPDAVATAYHALRRAEVPRGGSLCVVGAGGVGTHALALACALDPDVRLAAVVGSSASAERVAGLGVPVVVGIEDAARRLREQHGRFDAAIDFSGVAGAPSEGLELLARGGRLVLGSVVGTPLAFRMAATVAMARELEIVGVYSSTLADLEACLELVESGALDLAPSVSHRVPLAEAPRALALLEQRPPGLVRIVVENEGSNE